MKVLSYGGGVQTTALLRMAVEGLFERPDLVVFADTQDEPLAVYQSVEREFAAARRHGLECVVATRGRLSEWKANGSIHTPLYTSDGGKLFRTCTDRFKIEVVRRECRLHGMGHRKEAAEMWIGFTMDEIHRVGNRDKLPEWIEPRYPLLEMNMRRSDCERFLVERGVEPIKSACVYCPFRSNVGWQILKRRDPVSFAAAVEYDESIRDARPGLKSYVHRLMIPLASIPDLPPSLFDEREFDGDGCETGLCEVW